MKKIVINALQYKNQSSGIGVMIRELFSSFANVCRDEDVEILLTKDSPIFPANAGIKIIRTPFKYCQKIRRILYQTFVVGRKYCKNAIFLTTDSKTPFFLPNSCTLIPIITDLGIYRIPNAYQLSRVIWWRLQFQYLKRRANLFLTVSQFTKSEMVRILHIKPDKIYVIPCASNINMKRVSDRSKLETVRGKYNLPIKYFLFVGSNNPRKNIYRLIQAFDYAKRDGIPQDLIIAGEYGWKFSQSKAFEKIQHKNAVKFIGFVPDDDMPALYSAADAFLFPTLYEGFGIPIIEAQRCGTPVLTSNQSSLPEVGADSAIYVDPYDVEDIYRGIMDISLMNDGSILIKKGYENAEKYSWSKSANKLYEILTEVI